MHWYHQLRDLNHRIDRGTALGLQVHTDARGYVLFGEPYPFKAGDKLKIDWSYSGSAAPKHLVIQASLIITMNAS